jgi:hypothetical protein
MPCVYKLTRISDSTIIYVGSTKDIDCREYGHFKDSMNPRHTFRKAYDLILENGGWDNHVLEILEETDKIGTELLLLERKWYDELKPIGNTKRPILTEEERKSSPVNKKRAYFYNKWRKSQ